jgi:hypothetical protein
MGCYHPVTSYVRDYSIMDDETGEFITKSKVAFYGRNIDSRYTNDKEIQLPCGKCLACLESRAKEWALRLSLEASMHDHNAFVTFTLDDDQLYKRGNDRWSVQKRDMQLLNKRLNKKLKWLYGKDHRYKYFIIGEYGGETGRPHYHALFFNVKIPMLHPTASNGKNKRWTSIFLNDVWPYGHHDIGQVDFGSAHYVASYLQKAKIIELRQQTKQAVKNHFHTLSSDIQEKIFNGLKKIVLKQEWDNKIRIVNPEFSLKSRGLGLTWYEQNKESLFKGHIQQQQYRYAIPRYFMKKLEEDFPEKHEQIVQMRLDHLLDVDQTTDQLTFDHLKERERVMTTIKDKKDFDKAIRAVSGR